jgi:Protein of unknown function (DUF4232)
LKFGDESGAGGRTYDSYHLTNTGTALCTLAQPQVAYLSASGGVLKTVSISGSATVLSLKPGAVATLSVSDLESCAGPVAAQLRVTPPTDTSGVSIAATAHVCAPSATPLTAGAS